MTLQREVGLTVPTDRVDLSRRTPRRAVAGVVTALLLLVGTANGSASAAEPTLTVSGNKTASTVIELLRPTTVLHDASAHSPQVSVAGDGRVAGVVLSRIGAVTDSLVAVNFNLCGTPGCSGVPYEYVVGDVARTTDDVGGRIELPAGRYRVTLLADGAEVTARLSLSGLARSVDVRPVMPSSAAYRTVETVAGELPQRNLHSGGLTYENASRSVVLLQSAQRPLIAAAGSNGMCLIDGDGPPIEAYAPGCTTGDPHDRRFEARAPVVALLPEQFLTGFTTAVYVPRGRPLSIGQYYAGAVPVEDASYTQIEVPLG